MPSPETPLVTVAREGSRRTLAAVDAAAGRLGLRPGHAAAQAQASVPGLVMLDTTPDADAEALIELAGWCLRYSPVVQADPPDGILLDVAGSAHLFDGEAALMADMTRRLGRSGLAARAVIADTPGAAWALARHGRPGATSLPPGGSAAGLAPLPVAALRLDGETCRHLTLLGIERIGQLAAIPRAQLTRRFGPKLVACHDRALGHAPEPLTPLVPHIVPQARLAFAEPIGHAEGLAGALARLSRDLCRELDRRGLGLRRLDAVFRRVDGQPIGLRIGTAAPSRDPAHCVRLLRERLDAVDPGFGIDEIALLASHVEPMTARQSDAALDPDTADDGDPILLAPLVDRLGIRVGAGRVYRAAPVESRVPERSVRRIAALAPATGSTWPAALPRPSRIIDPPEPITAVALLPDNPPSFFVWRRVRYIVKAADGPERVRGEWWRAEAETASLRDYYRVEDQEGHRFWLFRDAPIAQGGRWWLHGRFA